MTIETKEPLWSKNFILLVLSAVFMYLSTFMLTPTLPIFARGIGLTDPSIGGFIVFAYTTGSMVPRMLWGNLADRRGRKLVYIVGLLIITAASPLFGLCFSFVWLIANRLIQGVGFSGSSTAAATMAVDLVPSSRRAEGIGYYSLANSLGMALGPALGLNMLQKYGSGALFATSVVCGSIGIGISFFINYEKRRRQTAIAAGETATPTRSTVQEPQIKKPGNFLGRLFEISVFKTCLVAFFMVLPYGGIMGYVALYGKDMGVTEIGLYFTVYAIALVVVRLMVGRLSDRYGPGAILIPGMLLMMAGLVVLFWANSLPVFLLSSAIFGLGYGSVVPVLQSSTYLFCSADRRGAASATLFTTLDLGYGIGAAILGLGIKNFSYAIAFAGSAIYVVIGMVLLFTVLLPGLKKIKSKA